MKEESCHILCLEYLVLFITCNDNPAKVQLKGHIKWESTLVCNFPAVVAAAFLRNKPRSPVLVTLVQGQEAWDLGNATNEGDRS